MQKKGIVQVVTNINYEQLKEKKDNWSNYFSAIGITAKLNTISK